MAPPGISNPLQRLSIKSLHALEMADAERIRIERKTQEQYYQSRETLKQELSAGQQQASSYEEAETKNRQEEHQRAGQVLEAVHELHKAAEDLLSKACLAHLAGVQMEQMDDPRQIPIENNQTALVFAQAQAAFIALRGSLVRLAHAHCQQEEWELARQVLTPLLEDTTAPLFPEAARVLSESYSLPIQAELRAQHWDSARQKCQEYTQKFGDTIETRHWFRQSYLIPANLALESGRWLVARQMAEIWLDQKIDDDEALGIRRESYLRPARLASQTKQWELAQEHLQNWINIQSTDTEAHNLRYQFLLAQAQGAIENGQNETAQSVLKDALNIRPGDVTTRNLLAESFDQTIRLALGAGNLDQAYEQLRKLRMFDPSQPHPEIEAEILLQEIIQAKQAARWSKVEGLVHRRLLLMPEDRQATILLNDLPEAMRLYIEQARQKATMLIPLTNGVRLELRQIPAGEFWQGSDNGQWVNVETCLIGKVPITNSQWIAFVDTVGLKTAFTQRDPALEDLPATNISWWEAQNFCEWAGSISKLSIRLPSDSEWEKAARGTDRREYPWGNLLPVASLCNFNQNLGHTTPVGKYSPQGDSPYGCSDMAGNIWEWTGDEHQGKKSRRGGAFDLFATDAMASFQEWSLPENRSETIGFRVCVATSG